MNTSVTRCRREGCGRPLRSKASIARGMSKACAIKEALRIAVAPYSPAQRDKAEKLIVAGGLKPLNRDGMYKVAGSDGTTVYRASALSCPCQARGLCYHRAAAALADAYRAVA